MAKIFTVASGKGGVGKSTFCTNIAIALGELGKNVLLIDGDAELRSLDLLLGVDEMMLYDWSDILENRCDTNKALLFYNEQVQLLPAPLEYPENLTCEKFADLIKRYSENYDYIFIDSPAGVGELPQIYAKCSDACIIVATADEISARSALITGNKLIKLGIKEENLRLIINRFDKKAVKQGKLLNIDDIIDKTYIRLLGIVPEEKNLMYASVTEKQISQHSDVKIAFSNIAKRISGKEIELYL
ncbi:MAG: AAA family ATPase [Clostridia bacterium]|nr:AAA family ATPase [Clostridia bacterium]